MDQNIGSWNLKNTSLDVEPNILYQLVGKV